MAIPPNDWQPRLMPPPPPAPPPPPRAPLITHASSSGPSSAKLAVFSAVSASAQLGRPAAWGPVGDWLDDGLDIVSSSIETARDKAREVRSEIGARAADAFNSVFDRATRLSEKTDRLEPGDQLTLELAGQLFPGLGGGGASTLEISRSADGSYIVSGAAEGYAGAGVGDLGTVYGGFGARVEFVFDNAEDAQRGALALVRASSPALAALEGNGTDQQFLAAHLSAIEGEVLVSGELDARFGLSDVHGGGAEGQTRSTVTTRVEFTDGKPSALVERASVSLSGTVEMPQSLGRDQLLDLLGLSQAAEQRLGFDPNELAGSAELTLQMEIRTPLSEQASVLDVLSDPQAHLLDKSGFSASLGGEFMLEDERGWHGELTMQGLSLEELQRLGHNASNGEPTHLFDGLTLDVAATGHSFTEEGLDATLDLVVGNGTVRNEIRREGEPHTQAYEIVGRDGHIVVNPHNEYSHASADTIERRAQD